MQLEVVSSLRPDCPVPAMGTRVPAPVEVAHEENAADVHVDADLIHPITSDVFDDAYSIPFRLVSGSLHFPNQLLRGP